jgi:hypothetical protein
VVAAREAFHIPAWTLSTPPALRGKALSRGTNPCANGVTTGLWLAASRLHRRRRDLGAFFRLMKARLGTPKAITATAHTLARLIYTMLEHGTAYVRQRMADYEQRYRDRTAHTLTRRAQALGCALVKTYAGTPMSRSLPRSSSLEGLRRSRGTRRPSAYSSTWVVRLPLAVRAMWEKAESGVAPCQCFSPAETCTTSPVVMTSCVASVAMMPFPAVTNST